MKSDIADLVIDVTIFVVMIWVIIRLNIWYYKRCKQMTLEECAEKDRIAQIENQIW